MTGSNDRIVGEAGRLARSGAMWSKIKALVNARKSSAAGVVKLDEAQVCATALLVEVALSDGIYAEVEAEQIFEIIRNTFALDDATAAAVLEEADNRAEIAADHHGFTKVVKKLPLEEREQLVDSMWRVVFADGQETPDEDAILRKLAHLLHVDPRASRLSRRNAADKGENGEE